MKQSQSDFDISTPPVQSPHPGLQALLPRLRSIGPGDTHKPVFDTQAEVRQFLADRDPVDEVFIVPVWAINHADLRRSEVVNWTFARHVH